MDASNNHRTALPPIQFLNSDKLRREEPEYKQRQHHEPPKSSLSASNILNAPYPTGPPPPYTASIQHPNPTPTATPHSQTPDMTVKRQEQQDTKHSLPSLSEALGGDRHAAYTTEGTAPPATQTAHATPLTRSPPSPRRHAIEPSPPHRPHAFGPIHPPYVPAEAASSRPVASEAHEFRRPEYPESLRQYNRRSPPLSQPTVQGHRGSLHGSDSGRAYETSPQGPPPPSSHFTYGYAHSASYTSASVAPATSAAHFAPSASHPSPESVHSYRSAAAAPLGARPPPQAYSESVKRHLDLYDFEESLNEIATHSTITLDFSRQYGARLHNSQRSGPSPGTLPAITEVDDLINKNRQSLEALSRLRESLIAHQAAYHQQTQEYLRLSQEGKRNDSIHTQDDSKSGGFAGGEPKKRRGRNAAPGRCHSCNRAETPEWRRGPDGARTLCNACGLHYAKLTRKAGANKAAVSSSSLRPKKENEGVEA